ncbi:MAG: histidine kinase [Pseudonocardia sediminis]
MTQAVTSRPAGTDPAAAGRGALEAPAVAAALAGLVLVRALIDLRLLPGGTLRLLDGPAATVAGVLAAFAQAGLVLWSRDRPRTVFGLLAVLAPVQFALVAVAPGYVWGVLAYAAARAPGRALGWVAAAATAPLVPATAWIVQRSPTPEVVITELLIFAVTAAGGALYIVIGLVAGRLVRQGADRVARRRLDVDRARRAAALADERTRIAEEVGDGVLAGLRRFVDRVEALSADSPAASGRVDRDVLRGIHEQARSVLASMRRVLAALRSERSEADPPEARPAGRDTLLTRWWPPASPDRAGWLAVGVVAAVVLAGGLVTTDPSIDPALDPSLTLLAVPGQSPAALIALSVQVVALAWWRSAPVPAVVTVAAASVASAFLGAGNVTADLAWLLPVWGAASRVPPRLSGPAVAVASLLLLAGASRSGALLGYLPEDVLDAVVVFAPVPALWLAGVLTHRHRTGLAEARSREAREVERRVVAEERMRVARDLHDVVAHHVSAVAVQAGAARVLTGDDEVADAVAHMADSARRIAAALPELAHLTPVAGGLVLDPDGVAELAEPSRSAGLPVTVEVHGTAADPPGDADLFAQRVLVEALTNVVRHAGPTPTRVGVGHDPDTVVVTVQDAGPVPGHRPPTTGSGMGLVGMRERAALLGGSVQAGPHGAGWRVRAVLHRPAPD